MAPGMIPVFTVCMNGILANFFAMSCFWVCLVNMAIIGVRGFMMFRSEDNKCAADHAVAYYYMGFLLFLSVPIILLAFVMTIGVVINGHQACQ